MYIIVDKKHSVRVTMNISPSVLATWAVLVSSGVWVSVKNDDVEATVVASLCCVCSLVDRKNLWCSCKTDSGEGDK